MLVSASSGLKMEIANIRRDDESYGKCTCLLVIDQREFAHRVTEAAITDIAALEQGDMLIATTVEQESQFL